MEWRDKRRRRRRKCFQKPPPPLPSSPKHEWAMHEHGGKAAKVKTVRGKWSIHMGTYSVIASWLCMPNPMFAQVYAHTSSPAMQQRQQQKRERERAKPFRTHSMLCVHIHRFRAKSEKKGQSNEKRTVRARVSFPCQLERRSEVF